MTYFKLAGNTQLVGCSYVLFSTGYLLYYCFSKNPLLFLEYGFRNVSEWPIFVVDKNYFVFLVYILISGKYSEKSSTWVYDGMGIYNINYKPFKCWEQRNNKDINL